MHIVILAGGSGTRFWPLSRRGNPKQLLPILGKNSMLSLTIKRAMTLNPKEILIITGADQLEQTETSIRRDRAKALSKGVNLEVIGEPCGRNTAPAIALAARLIANSEKRGVMAVLPADHYIKERKAFIEVIRQAEEIAEKGYLVTLGISTKRPETGYGYIERGKKKILKGYNVKSFIEKPPLEKARRYHGDADFYWNSGMFVWRADIFTAECKRRLPDIHSSMNAFAGLAPDSGRFHAKLADVYEKLPSISVDYGIMEKTEKAAVIPVEITWNDVGSWPSLFELRAGKSDKLIGNTEIIDVGSKRCYVHSVSGKPVALVGAEDLVVVETEDALLVCSMEKGQDVGKAVEMLKKAKRRELL